MTDINTPTEHKDHILPVKLYLGVGAVLFFLTIVTVAVSRFDLGQFNLLVAMIIAIIKASIVGLFFMHLLWDRRFYMSAMLMSVLFLGVFIIITMSDTLRRGDIYEEVRHPIESESQLYKNLDKSGGNSHNSTNNHAESDSEEDETKTDPQAPTH